MDLVSAVCLVVSGLVNAAMIGATWKHWL